MFELLSHSALQHYWWAIISLLAALLVFLLFVQGGQSLIYQIGKTENDRTLLLNTFGRKWEFTFTTLVTFGGAFFASFPLFYSTSFGGAYAAWMVLLFCFIIQAISYEYRSKPNNFLGKKTFDAFLFVNGLMGPLLIGVVVGTFFNGADYSVSNLNVSKWQHPAKGLEALLNIYNVSLGLAVLFLARILGLLYIINSVDSEKLVFQTRKHLIGNTIIFLVFFLVFVLHLIIKDGYAYNPDTMKVSIEPFKYFHNLVQMPVVLLLFLAGVIAVLWGIFIAWKSGSTKGIWFTGGGTILVVFSLMLIAGYNNTCYYPSNFDLQSSLNILNSSSSRFTLTTMSYVSLLVPFVLAYIWFAWKEISKKKITETEVSGGSEGHIY
jgi:cytochrome bd ubiquinol oxidase subunit II